MTGTAEAQTVLRVLGRFAQRNLLPDRMVVDRDRGEVRLVILQAGLDNTAAAGLAEKLRTLVIAHSVDCAWVS